MANATTVEELLVRFSGDLQSLEKAFDRLEQTVSKNTKQVEEAGGRMDKAFSAVAKKLAAAFSIGAIIAFTKSSVAAADALIDLSKRFNISVEALSAFDYVARQSGTTVEVFASGIKSMQKNLSEASSGADQAEQNFTSLGLSIADLKDKSPEEQFIAIAEKIGKLNDASDRTAAAMSIFGKAGTDLIPIINEGSASIEEMLQKARELGIVMDEETARKIDEFNDKVSEVTQTLQSMARDAFVVLYDAVIELDVAYARLIATLLKLGKSEEEQAKINENLAKYIREVRGEIDKAGKASGGLGGNFDRLSQDTEDFRKKLKDLHDELNIRLVKTGMTELEKKLYDVDVLVMKNKKSFEALGKEGRDYVETIKEQVKALHEYEEDTQYVADRIKEMADNVQGVLADAIFDGFEGRLNSVTDILDRLKSVVFRTIAEMAAAGAMKQLGNLFTGGGSGGGGLSGGSLLNGGSSIISALTGGTSSMVSSGLLSLGSGGIPLGGFGAASTIASIAPFALPAAAIALPLLAGSFKSKPHPASTFGGTLQQSGEFGADFKVLSKHIDDTIGEAIGQRVAAITKSLSSQGFNLGGLAVMGGTDVGKGGGFLEIAGQNRINFDVNSVEDTNRALGELIQQFDMLTGTADNELSQSIRRLQAEGRDAATILNSLNLSQFMKDVDREILKITDPIQADLLSIKEQFDAMVESAKAMGASAEDIAKIENLRDLSAQQAAQSNSALSQKNQEAISKLTEAMREAERLATQFERAADSMRDALEDLTFGGLSNLTPIQKLEQATALLNDTVSQAIGGHNIDALERLPDVVKNFLEQSAAVNSIAGKKFSSDREYAMNLLSQAMGISGDEAVAQRANAASIQTQIAGLQQSSSTAYAGMDINQLISAIQKQTATQARSNQIIEGIVINNGSATYPRRA